MSAIGLLAQTCPHNGGDLGRPLAPDLALAFAMALHPRLGLAAPAAALGGDLVRHVLEGHCGGALRVCL